MKARLYKMTTYFCVINESYETEDIKDFIEDSLSGEGMITRCDNEVVGPEIEWYDDIDLNLSNSTIKDWEKYFNRRRYNE